jgi:uncharacterized protein (TIGR02646 family)
MRPVDKGETLVGFRNYGEAKPDLLERLGQFCSYCESPGSPQHLHVEHIYPKAETAHPDLDKKWRNLLIACSSCNSYKNIHLGNYRQNQILKKYLWPHFDNTFNGFAYEPNGRVMPNSGLNSKNKQLAQSMCNMVGLMSSPASASGYKALGIAYDGITKRAEAWGIAERACSAYEANPTSLQVRVICDTCVKTGHFSIWMEVFHNHRSVRLALIKVCKAATSCFDPLTSIPISRGRV